MNNKESKAGLWALSQLPQTQTTQSPTSCLNKIKTDNTFSVNYDKYSLFSAQKTLQ